jgi:hypothetical protein
MKYFCSKCGREEDKLYGINEFTIINGSLICHKCWEQEK